MTKKIQYSDIPYHKPIIDSNVSDILEESVSSGWLTTGPKVKEFEDRLASYLNVEHVVALNSCTAGLHLCLAALDLGPDHKFIAPTYTFVATVEAGEYQRASPVLVDCDAKSMNIDLNRVEELLRKDVNSKIKVIIPVHFGGQAVNISELYRISEKYGVFVLEDAAHSLETVADLSKSVPLKDAAALSFYANKNITSGGEGGALATNDIDIANKVRQLSLHGMSKDGWKRFSVRGKWEYDVSKLGYKYNMTDISASFGLDQLNNIHTWHSRRVQIAKRYQTKLGNMDGIELPTHDSEYLHAWHLFVIRVTQSKWRISRNQLIVELSERGVGTSVHYIPVHMHSYYVNKYGFSPDDYPNAFDNSKRAISLPIYPALTDSEVDYIIDTINTLWIKFKVQ